MVQALNKEDPESSAEPVILTIEMLGGLRVRSGSVVIAQYTPQQTGALLALLALNLNRPCPREMLIETIWPNADVEAGRASLRQGLYKLRQQLESATLPHGGLFLRTQTDIQLNPAVVTTDVFAFERTLQESGTKTDERMQRLAEAIDLYRAPLLPGFYQEVFALERRRLMRTYQTALHDLAVTAELQGDMDGAIAYVRHAVGRFPRWAEIRVELMRLYTSAGQPSEALHEYANLRDLLQGESGDASDEEARASAAHYERIARAALVTVSAAQPEAPPAENEARGASASWPSRNEQTWRTDGLPIPPERIPAGAMGRGPSVSRFLAWAALVLLSGIGLAIRNGWMNLPALHAQRSADSSMDRSHIFEPGFSWNEGVLDPIHHRLYLPNAGTTGPNGVGVLDLQTNCGLASISAGYGLSGVAVDTRTDRIFVANRQSNRISYWDARTGGRLGGFPCPNPNLSAMVFDAQAQLLFTVNAQPTTLSAFDPDGNLLHSQPLKGTGAVRVIPDSRYQRVFVVYQDSDFVPNSNCVQVFDMNTFTMISRMDTDVSPMDLAVDEESNRIYVTNSRSGTLDVFDGSNYSRLTTLTFNGRHPDGIALDPVTGRLYICCTDNGSLVVVNSHTLAKEGIYGPFTIYPSRVSIDASARRLYLLACAGCVYTLSLP